MDTSPWEKVVDVRVFVGVEINQPGLMLPKLFFPE